MLEAERRGKFSSGYLTSTFMLSESFENLNEQIEDFIEEDGKITSVHIEELAGSCDDLNTLLEEGVVTSEALARILQEGIQPTELSDSLIAALNTLDDVDSRVKSIIDDFNDFDPGFTETDIPKFFNDAYEAINDAVERNAFGNNQIKTYLSKLFDMSDFDKMSSE